MCDMTAKINQMSGVRVVATTFSGTPYGPNTHVDDISAIAVATVIYEQHKPAFAVCIRRKLLDENLIYSNGQWVKVRGSLPNQDIDGLPSYTAYGMRASPAAEITLYETAVVVSVGGPGTHEALTADGWKLQPGGLRLSRELRIDRNVITSNPSANKHATFALDTIKYLEPFVYFGDTIAMENNNILKYCLSCGWGRRCGCPDDTS